MLVCHVDNVAFCHVDRMGDISKKRLRSLVAALRRDDKAVMSPAKIIKKTAVCNSTPLVCHSMFTVSLARFAFSHPRGLKTLPLFIEGVPEGGGSIYATRDQWLQNSPITKWVIGSFCF